MTNRIDHATEARAYLRDVEAYVNDAQSYRFNDENDRAALALTHAGLSAQQAQVHAQLALVEQQRIANLVALMDSPRTATSVARVAERALMQGEPVADRELRPDIAAALGIEVRE